VPHRKLDHVLDRLELERDTRLFRVVGGIRGGRAAHDKALRLGDFEHLADEIAGAAAVASAMLPLAASYRSARRAMPTYQTNA